jgi:ubiquinone/menaquinone biosynthesis C-methylase UbiE
MSVLKDFKFDKRAVSYDEGLEGKLSKRFYNLLLNRLDLKQDETVLDVGCGTGTILKRISERIHIYGYGIDVEENMITQAKSKCPDMNISISNCTQMPFEDGQFDIVTACMAYHHFDDKKGFAKEASRVLKNHGYLYITDPYFPFLMRVVINLVFRIHKIAAHFGTSQEIASDFKEYGFELVDVSRDKYAQCIKLRKVS